MVVESPQVKNLAGLAKGPTGEVVHWLIRVEGLAPVEQIEAIGQAFCLDHLVLEDIVNAHQRSNKVEEYDDYIYWPCAASWPMRTRSVGGGWRAGRVGEPDVGPPAGLTLLAHLAQRLQAPQSRLRRKGADYLLGLRRAGRGGGHLLSGAGGAEGPWAKAVEAELLSSSPPSAP